MTRFERENLKVRFIRLADLKSTGSPAELAERFEISVRSVKRLASDIRGTVKEFRYSFARKSYVIEKEYM